MHYAHAANAPALSHYREAHEEVEMTELEVVGLVWLGSAMLMWALWAEVEVLLLKYAEPRQPGWMGRLQTASVVTLVTLSAPIIVLPFSIYVTYRAISN